MRSEPEPPRVVKTYLSREIHTLPKFIVAYTGKIADPAQYSEYAERHNRWITEREEAVQSAADELSEAIWTRGHSQEKILRTNFKDWGDALVDLYVLSEHGWPSDPAASNYWEQAALSLMGALLKATAKDRRGRGQPKKPVSYLEIGRIVAVSQFQALVSATRKIAEGVLADKLPTPLIKDLIYPGGDRLKLNAPSDAQALLDGLPKWPTDRMIWDAVQGLAGHDMRTAKITFRITGLGSFRSFEGSLSRARQRNPEFRPSALKQKYAI